MSTSLRELEIAFRYICTSDWFLIHDLETQSIERCLETLVEVLHESGYLTNKDNIFEVLFSLLMLETQRTNPIASRKSQQLVTSENVQKCLFYF